MDRSIDEIRGQISALNAVLLALLTSIPPEMARAARRHLKIEHDLSMESEEEDPVPEAQAATRQALVLVYLEMLAVQSRELD